MNEGQCETIDLAIYDVTQFFCEKNEWVSEERLGMNEKSRFRAP